MNDYQYNFICVMLMIIASDVTDNPRWRFVCYLAVGAFAIRMLWVGFLS